MARDRLQQGTALGDFLWVLDKAEAELSNVFREEGVVDFQEITSAATLALGEPESPSDLLYSLDYRIEHILVDEFQDTSRAQHELLKGLTGQWSDGDGRTLFLVGDPVQSIYGFRAAEVALFSQAWEDERLGAVRLTPVRLQSNFRSTPEIVGWIERSLSPGMAVTDKVKGAVKLERAVASRSGSGKTPQVIPLIEDRMAVARRKRSSGFCRAGKTSARRPYWSGAALMSLRFCLHFETQGFRIRP